MPAPRTTQETGWLADLVYTSKGFESGLAFFADGLGRITRFSREPADLASARRLAGQAALPGLVNTHSRSAGRVARGRGGWRGGSGAGAVGPNGGGGSGGPGEDPAPAMTGEQVYDAARMSFLEMMLSGITCVGEFHTVLGGADGAACLPDGSESARQVVRAARDTGMRIALVPVAGMPGGKAAASAAYAAEMDALRAHVAEAGPADEAWLGAGIDLAGGTPMRAGGKAPGNATGATGSAEFFKDVAAYAHTHRLRLHLGLPLLAADQAAFVAAHGRTPAVRLAELGLLAKRSTLVNAGQLSPEEARVVGGAKATVCVCPSTERALGCAGPGPIEILTEAGASLALGSGGQACIDLMEEARLVEFAVRAGHEGRALPGCASAAALFMAASFAGARGLGAPGGALDVGRPADFFTVNLFDPVLVGSGAEGLLAAVLGGLERRAVRDVWIGARQQVSHGRHPEHGSIIGRFAELQGRLWGGGAAFGSQSARPSL